MLKSLGGFYVELDVENKKEKTRVYNLYLPHDYSPAAADRVVTCSVTDRLSTVYTVSAY